jgi:hypothetical protein
MNDWPIFRRGIINPPAQLDCRFNLRCFRRSKAMLPEDFVESGPVQSRQAAQLLEQTLTYLNCILARHTHT